MRRRSGWDLWMGVGLKWIRQQRQRQPWPAVDADADADAALAPTVDAARPAWHLLNPINAFKVTVQIYTNWWLNRGPGAGQGLEDGCQGLAAWGLELGIWAKLAKQRGAEDSSCASTGIRCCRPFQELELKSVPPPIDCNFMLSQWAATFDAPNIQ